MNDLVRIKKKIGNRSDCPSCNNNFSDDIVEDLVTEIEALRIDLEALKVKTLVVGHPLVLKYEIDCLRNKLDIAVKALEWYDGVHRQYWAIDLNDLSKIASNALYQIQVGSSEVNK